MKVTTQFVGADFFAQVEKALEATLDAGAVRMESAIVDLMPGGGAGVKPGTGGDTGVRARYNASTAGNPPGVRSGFLRNSITTRKRRLSRTVGTNVKYARIQEFGGTINHPGGTPYIVVGPGRVRFIGKEAAKKLEADGRTVKRTRQHQITLPPRPYMRPGFKQGAPRAIRAMSDTMDREMAKVVGL